MNFTALPLLLTTWLPVRYAVIRWWMIAIAVGLIVTSQLFYAFPNLDQSEELLFLMHETGSTGSSSGKQETYSPSHAGEIPQLQHEKRSDHLRLLALPKSTAAVISDLREGSSFPQVFYRANIEPCGLNIGKVSARATERMVFPLYNNGYSAGPIIDCTPAMVVNGTCNPEEKLVELEAVKALIDGKALQFFLPHQTLDKYTDAVVVTRPRLSSSTGVAFIDDEHLAVASYGLKKIYLYKYSLTGNQKFARLLNSVDTSGNPDLIDIDHKRNLIVASQLMRGTQELYKFDLDTGNLIKYKEVNAFGVDRQQWCHEATFYPSTMSSVIVASSSKSSDRKTLMISFFDYESEKVVAEYMMQSDVRTHGFKAQGIRFIDKNHFIADMTSLVVQKYRDWKLCKKTYPPKKKKAQGRIAVFKMNFSVDDIVSGNDEPASSSAFTVLDTYDIGIAAVDGMDYQNGVAIVADQMNDKVVKFSVDVTAEKPLKLISEQRGYLMPHGVAISKVQRHIAVSCYGDNSVIVEPY